MKCVTTLAPTDVPREEQDEGDRLIKLVLSEVVPLKTVWSPERNCYVNDPPIDDKSLYRAREIVYQKLGWPYEWVED